MKLVIVSVLALVVAFPCFGGDPFCEEGGWGIAKLNGFYPDMPTWSAAAWYEKSLAKRIQAQLYGLEAKTTLVSLADVEFLHPIDAAWPTSYQAQLQRQTALEASLRANPALRDVSIESLGGAPKGVRLQDGKIVLIDGNGRLFAAKRAVAALKGNPADYRFNVQLIEHSATPAGTGDLIREAQAVRGGLNFDPVSGKVTKRTPASILLNGRSVPMNKENAVRAYYDALATKNLRMEMKVPLPNSEPVLVIPRYSREDIKIMNRVLEARANVERLLEMERRGRTWGVAEIGDGIQAGRGGGGLPPGAVPNLSKIPGWSQGVRALGKGAVAGAAVAISAVELYRLMFDTEKFIDDTDPSDNPLWGGYFRRPDCRKRVGPNYRDGI